MQTDIVLDAGRLNSLSTPEKGFAFDVLHFN